jgi:hypothetical protein
MLSDRETFTRPRCAVFAGPSLHGVDGAVAASCARRPPARWGDLLALPGVEAGGWTIAIIDGEFRQSLAVTVTEIRDVLASGNRVVGGSSMGALRAVECAPLGMEGIGWIFEGYRDGRLFSDADVALTYDPDTYEPLTVPLVNLRWLSCLLESRTTGGEDTDHFLAQAATVPFRYRDMATLRDIARDSLSPEVAVHWLDELRDERRGAWDRKRADALAVLGALERPRCPPVWRPAPPDLPSALRGTGVRAPFVPEPRSRRLGAASAATLADRPGVLGTPAGLTKRSGEAGASTGCVAVPSPPAAPCRVSRGRDFQP